jgi:proton-dependent oligopeptide transporter, POT family
MIEMSDTYRTAPHDTDRMPPGIPFIVGNEAAERFSYYGMLSILAVFLTDHLLNAKSELDPLSDAEATKWQSLFQAAVYITPLFGAILSDWLWGKYRTILTLSLFYVVGHAVMALVDVPQLTGLSPRWMLGIGLGLIALGAGGIKPCVTAHVGDQFGTANSHLLPKVFGWFYLSINLGAVISQALIPWLLETYGPSVAFGLPGGLMALALFVFWLGRREFAHIPPGGAAFVREVFTPQTGRILLKLIPLYLLTIPFWSLFDQSHTSMVLQAKSLDLSFGTFTLKPAQLQLINPLMILMFVPLISYGIEPLVAKFARVTPLRKIATGMFITVPSFAILALLQRAIDGGASPSWTWHVLVYAFLTVAEVLISITTLEFSYTQAPNKLKSLIMGVFFITGIAFGNLLTAAVSARIAAAQERGSQLLEGENYYWFFTAVMLAGAVAFVVYSQFYRGRTYVQGES